MIEIYLEAPHTLERFRSSPAGPYLDDFAAAIHAAGFGWLAGMSRLRDAVHLGQWAAQQGLTLDSLDESCIEMFEAHLDRCSCSGGRPCKLVWAGRRARHFVAYLRDGSVARPVADRAGRERCRHVAVDDFSEWMRRHRGVTDSTLRSYGRTVTALLDRLGDDPERYTPHTLRAVVLEQARGHGVSKAELVATAVRMFLRYLCAVGQCSPHLVDAIPRMHGRRLTTLPRHLPGEDVEKLVASCYQAKRGGLRDRAILLLLARLGLRAGDIMGLRVTDIDWSDATVRVQGKGRREARLPLPQDVGDAILVYLEKARPKTNFNHVFLTAVAPWRPLGSNATVSDIVARAIERAGVDAPTCGAHLLRHSAATAMLRDGASLSGIGEVLRHRSIETTAHYARVDVRLLQQVAQPWTEVSPC